MERTEGASQNALVSEVVSRGHAVDAHRSVLELNASAGTIASRAAAQVTEVPAAWNAIRVRQGEVVLNYRREPSIIAHPALITAGGVMWSSADTFITPLHYGAVGDGITDDGAAINAALAAYRAIISGISNQNGSVDFDGLGRVYRSTISIDATGITSWGWKIANLTIHSEATGKTAFDLIGSRGGYMSQVMIWGDALAMPRIGFMAARAAEVGQTGYCDHVMWDRCNTRGYFSLTGVYFYGQESCSHEGCEYWNSHPDGHSAVIVGYDIYPVQSDYILPRTGSSSHINVSYFRCDFRHLPSTGYANIVGVTMGAPLRVSVSSVSQWSVGDTVVIGEHTGAAQMFNLKATITAIEGSILVFGNVDATGWDAWQSGGVVARSQTVATMMFGRTQGHTFDSCYWVNYGTDAIEVVFPDGQALRSSAFRNALFEGYGSRSAFHFNAGAALFRDVIGFEFDTYQDRVRNLLSTDIAAGGYIRIRGCKLAITSGQQWTKKLFLEESKFLLVEADIFAVIPNSINAANFVEFGGKITVGDERRSRNYRQDFSGGINRNLLGSQSALTDNYCDAFGVARAYSRWSPNGGFTWSTDAATTDYSMVRAGFWPETDATADLGQPTRRWRRVHASAFYADGVPGVNGSFLSADGRTVTVTKGIITSIT